MIVNNIGNIVVIYLVVVLKIGGYKFRVLLDSGVSYLYVLLIVIDLINVWLKFIGLR